MKRVIELSKAEADVVLIEYVRERDGLPKGVRDGDTNSYKDADLWGLVPAKHVIRLAIP